MGIYALVGHTQTFRGNGIGDYIWIWKDRVADSVPMRLILYLFQREEDTTGGGITRRRWWYQVVPLDQEWEECQVGSIVQENRERRG